LVHAYCVCGFALNRRGPYDARLDVPQQNHLLGDYCRLGCRSKGTTVTSSSGLYAEGRAKAALSLPTSMPSFLRESADQAEKYSLVKYAAVAVLFATAIV
jgi:hypothetical protein